MATTYYGEEYDFILGEFHYDNSDFVRGMMLVDYVQNARIRV